VFNNTLRLPYRRRSQCWNALFSWTPRNACSMSWTRIPRNNAWL